MKVTRQKHARKILNFYKNKFGMREPYQVIVDGTFCQAALECRIHIKEQLPAYIGSHVKLMTTACVLEELRLLGDEFLGALLISRKYETRRCNHTKAAVAAGECIKSIIGEDNKDRYCVATQDNELKADLRKRPVFDAIWSPWQQQIPDPLAGVPIFYINYNCIVIEHVSDTSQQHSRAADATKLLPSTQDRAAFPVKRKASEMSGAGDAAAASGDTPKPKRKRPSAPNPLSVKRKKTAAAAKPPMKRPKKTDTTTPAPVAVNGN